MPTEDRQDVVIVEIPASTIPGWNEINQQSGVAQTTKRKCRQKASVKAVTLAVLHHIQGTAITVFANIRQAVEVELDLSRTPERPEDAPGPGGEPTLEIDQHVHRMSFSKTR